MEDDDSDADSKMADYGTDFSDDVDPNLDAKALHNFEQGSTVEITVGNRESDPPFSRVWGDFPIPDSRLAGNRETGNPRFPIRPGPGIGVPGGGGV
jgi:hypothetical protein